MGVEHLAEPVQTDLLRKMALFRTHLAYVLIFILGIIAGAGGFARYKKYIAAPPVSSYEKCVKASESRIQQSYPAVCITKEGNMFREPILMITPVGATSCQTHADCVTGIQINRCCACPTAVNKSIIGSDSWETYIPGTDYSGRAQCDPRVICTPCEIPTIPVCANNRCGFVHTQTPTCRPRPKCLDQEPRCLMPETEDMCPPEPIYTCPEGGWENCMPILSKDEQIQCTKEALRWKQKNCAGFKGAAW